MSTWSRHRQRAEQVLAYIAKEPLSAIHHHRVARLSRQIGRFVSTLETKMPPVIFFNPSARLSGLSLNAAFSLLASWALRFSGRRVVHLVCKAGLKPCLLGTWPEDPETPPPCPGCISQSQRLYAGAEVRWFDAAGMEDLRGDLQGLNLEQLVHFEYQKLPLGASVLPSMRWVLRRHHLKDDSLTRKLIGFYIESAWHVARKFTQLVNEVKPDAVVVFNGMFYPEAVARHVARRMGIRSITHEVGIQSLSAFFSEGEATAYPIELPNTFELTFPQNRKLDQYLAQRVQGHFTMGGIRFWPTITPLSPHVLDRLSSFKRMVAVFTNVVFDTSQPHSNVIFSDMFDWLDQIFEIMKEHPETLFIIRAHPDEYRPGKRSRETVAEWVANRPIQDCSNMVFIDADEPASSYELIERAHVVMVYNSTIGLEASMMGKAVVCGGKARFTPFVTGYQPESREAFKEQTRQLLGSETLSVPERFRINARRFMYYHLFCASLPFSDYLSEDRKKPGCVTLKDIPLEKFNPSHSPILKAIVEGVLGGKDFVIGE